VVNELRQIHASALEALKPIKGITPETTDHFISEIQRARPRAIEKAKYLKSISDIDFKEIADDLSAKEALEKSFAQGSRRSVLGGTVGAAIGMSSTNNANAAMYATIGAMTGATLDVYGAKIHKKWLDISNTKYGRSFKNLVTEASATPRDVLITHRLLFERSPEYRAAMTAIPSEDEKSAYVNKIKDSKIDSIEKSKILSDLAETGLIAE
jgi:hypothetical protein